MVDDLAASNVNRAYSLAATCIAIFTFLLIFLYPRYTNGEIDPVLFQATLLVMGVATFAFVFASLHYYAVTRGDRIDEADRSGDARRGDRLWLLGTTLLLLAPSLVLVSVELTLVGAAWFALWLGYLVFMVRFFPRVQTGR